MDRKFCVLLYSNHSKASLDVLNYIRNLSKMFDIDFPTITGMTMVCIDNPEFKLTLHNNGITYVPTLLVEYYNGSKQKFERDYIYEWIDQIITRNLPVSQYTTVRPSGHASTAGAEGGDESQSSEYQIDSGVQSPKNHQSPLGAASSGYSNRTPINSPQNRHLGPLPPTDPQGDHKGEVQTPDVAPTAPVANKKPDISAIALEMQKNRDLELAEIKEYQKPI